MNFKKTLQVLRALITLMAITAAIPALGVGGDLVNNGGGIAEKNILFAYERLETYMKLCLSTEICKIDVNQKAILQQISAGLAEEKKVPDQIRFSSEKNQPGFFIIDREVKIAKTGSRIGSPIYINTDLLYTKNEMGFFIPTSITDAVAILIHELGHHYGAYSHTDLDLLGIKVALMLQHKTYSTPLLPWSQQISATIINGDLNLSFPDIVLYVEDQAIDISSKFFDIANCYKFIPIPILPIPDIPIDPKKPMGSVIHNVHWYKMKVDGDKAELAIEADLSHVCKKSKDESFRSQEFRLKIEFTVTKNTEGKWSLSNDTLKLEQKKDAWWKIINFSSRR